MYTNIQATPRYICMKIGIACIHSFPLTHIHTYTCMYHIYNYASTHTHKYAYVPHMSVKRLCTHLFDI